MPARFGTGRAHDARLDKQALWHVRVRSDKDATYGALEYEAWK